MKDKKKVKQGKANKAAGARFELKVRKDLESKGWIVSKWMNNVEIHWFCGEKDIGKNKPIKDNYHDSSDFSYHRILIPAKHKFRGPGIPMAIGTGFPDFVAYTNRFCMGEFTNCSLNEALEIPLIASDGKTPMNPLQERYLIIGVEVKSNGYLTKIEKEKCNWLLENNIFSKILIASKGEKRGSIKYVEFKESKGGK